MADVGCSVHVALRERSYCIEIGSGTLAKLGEFVASRFQLSHAAVVTDSNVERFHGDAVRRSMNATGARVDVMVVEAGEASKSVEKAEQLWQWLADVGCDRKSVLVAAGGGVIGDLAGFAAATYARGLAYVQVPTTLLAQVDSSVGGKVGINLPAAKNMVGAFWQPAGVLIDTHVLRTLPVREYRSGLAEVVKYGVILDPDLFSYLEQHASELQQQDEEVLCHIIARCCQLKADVVEVDEREETGKRAVLNYGHTFGHAIESVTGYGQYLHGEAVAIGMLCASRLAESLRRISSDLTDRQRALLERLGLPVELPDVDHDALLSAMRSDKKVAHGRLRFVLPTRIGHVELVEGIDEVLIRSALRT